MKHSFLLISMTLLLAPTISAAADESACSDKVKAAVQIHNANLLDCRVSGQLIPNKQTAIVLQNMPIIEGASVVGPTVSIYDVASLEQGKRELLDQLTAGGSEVSPIRSGGQMVKVAVKDWEKNGRFGYSVNLFNAPNIQVLWIRAYNPTTRAFYDVHPYDQQLKEMESFVSSSGLTVEIKGDELRLPIMYPDSQNPNKYIFATRVFGPVNGKLVLKATERNPSSSESPK